MSERLRSHLGDSLGPWMGHMEHWANFPEDSVPSKREAEENSFFEIRLECSRTGG